MTNIEVLFEDDDIIAVNKPAGVLVYLPDGFDKEETLLDMLSDKLNFEEIDQRNGVVHRLDRETSGVILFAKNKEAEEALKAIFKKRKIKKYYKALCFGDITPKTGKIDIPLGRGAKDRLKVVPKGSGRVSVTNYEQIKYFPKSDISFLDIEIETGRTHQIRVHLSSIGYPVVGDVKYTKKKSDLGRQFLHASKISFKHPFSGKLLEITSELPNELKTFLNQLS